MCSNTISICFILLFGCMILSNLFWFFFCFVRWLRNRTENKQFGCHSQPVSDASSSDTMQCSGVQCAETNGWMTWLREDGDADMARALLFLPCPAKPTPPLPLPTRRPPPWIRSTTASFWALASRSASSVDCCPLRERKYCTSTATHTTVSTHGRWTGGLGGQIFGRRARGSDTCHPPLSSRHATHVVCVGFVLMAVCVAFE